MEEETQKRNILDEQYVTLIEKERLYYSSAKEYQEECKKTEILEEKIRKSKKSQGKEIGKYSYFHFYVLFL